MAHTHIVADSDAHFIIDPLTRAIKKEESAKTSLIVGDHNSERFSFELPRYIEGHDMSLCNVIRVHYMNTNASRPEQQSTGVYEVDDFGIMSTDDTKVGLSWLISNNVTKYVGKLAFTVQFACMTGYKVDYSWQSGIYSAITVSDGINGSEIVFDEYADILQQWWLKLYATSELPIKVYTSEEFAALNGNTESGVLYLLEDDPTLDILKSHGDTLTNHGERLTDTENNIKSHVESLVNHDTRLTGAENNIESHGNTLTNHDTRLTDAENDIKSHDGTLTNHGERLIIAETNIDMHDSMLTEHGERLDEIENDIKPLCKYQPYEPRTGSARIPIIDGLWLFQVSYKDSDSVSVIMDTYCKYSSMFILTYTGTDGSTIRELGVLERTLHNPVNGYMEVALRRFNISSNAEIVEASMGTYTIYGKPFGFSNPVG